MIVTRSTKLGGIDAFYSHGFTITVDLEKDVLPKRRHINSLTFQEQLRWTAYFAEVGLYSAVVDTGLIDPARIVHWAEAITVMKKGLNHGDG